MASILDFFSRSKRAERRGRPRNEPKRDSIPWPNLSVLGQPYPQTRRVVYKPTPKNLRYFSHTPIARRAINAIRNPISQLEWEIAPRKGVEENSEIKRQIAIVEECFALPNGDDNFSSLISQVVEDILVGAGAIEIGRGGDQTRPLWLWPVDGLSIQLMPGWSGGASEARYVQTVGYGAYTAEAGQGIMLRNDELIYIRPNPSTATPFGFGPLEIAFNSIARQLSTAEFAGKVAGNALPPFMLDLGDVSANVVNSWRTYWTNDVEGRGTIPIIGTEHDQPGAEGKARGPSAIRLYPEGDSALFLAYQAWIRTEIAAAFDLSNMALNLERDVNRSTSEVLEDRDWTHAILPCANMVRSHLTREAIWNTLGFSQIEFKWVGLEREDEAATADILTKYYDRNIFTGNEIREKLGEPNAEHVWGDMTHADVEIAKMAARGVGIVDDPNLASNQTRPPNKAAQPQPKPQPAKKDADR